MDGGFVGCVAHFSFDFLGFKLRDEVLDRGCSGGSEVMKEGKEDVVGKRDIREGLRGSLGDA